MNRQTPTNSSNSHFRGNRQRDGALTPAFSMPNHSNVDLQPEHLPNRSKSEKYIPFEEDDDDLLQVPLFVQLFISFSSLISLSEIGKFALMFSAVFLLLVEYLMVEEIRFYEEWFVQ